MNFSHLISSHNNSEPLPYRALLWNKFIEEISSKDITSLSEIQRPVALAFWYDAEMNNGGHSGYFDCYPNTSPEMLIDALVLVGASTFADNFRKAVLTGRNDDYVATDQVFSSGQPCLTDILREYIASHSGMLGIVLN